MARSDGPRPTASWKPPVANREGGRLGANLTGPGTGINKGNIFAAPTDIATGDVGRGVNDFAGGWSGLSSATTSAADDLKGLYDREYARDVLNQWPWWSGGGWGYGSSGSSGDGYSNPYSTEEEQANDSTANSESQEQNDSESSSESGHENTTDSDQKTTVVRQCMESAVLAFQKGDYGAAQSRCEQAIRLAPGNADMQQFLGLCQFAQGKYRDAAAALYAVLADGPGWNWKTLSSFYTSTKTYTKHLRALEEYVKEGPQDAAGRFVLAYQYLVLDERDAALRQLQHVCKLRPQDKLSAGIAQALLKAKEGSGAPANKPRPELGPSG